MSLDQVGISASDCAASAAFYKQALAPLGLSVLVGPEESQGWTGFGVGKPQFWLRPGEAQQPPVHVIFAGPDAASVEQFHEAALAAGGESRQAPGVQSMGEMTVYRAIVLDPDGNLVMASCDHD